MRMSVQKRQVRPRRHFSRKEFGRYFFPKPVSRGLIVITTAGVVLGLVGLSLTFTAGLNYLILALVGVVVLCTGVYNIRAIINANPGDADYDDWLEDQASAMMPMALRTLNLKESQITSQILRMHSIILPGSSEADNYRDNACLKRGKDGQWRSSINLYTFFFPTERFIAIFTRSINIFDPVMPFDDISEEFFYRDIISVSFSVFQDTVVFDDQEFLYRVQQCSLKIANSDDIHLGGYLSAVPIDRSQGAPIIILPDSGINQILGDLRALLRVKKQRGR
jgi:hypothetical protein